MAGGEVHPSFGLTLHPTLHPTAKPDLHPTLQPTRLHPSTNKEAFAPMLEPNAQPSLHPRLPLPRIGKLSSAPQKKGATPGLKPRKEEGKHASPDTQRVVAAVPAFR